MRLLRAPSDLEWAVDTDTDTGTGIGVDRDCNGESGVRFIDIDGIGSRCICRRIDPPRERGAKGWRGKRGEEGISLLRKLRFTAKTRGVL